MKLLIVSNLFPPAHLGGYELACRDTADVLAMAGHDCHVLTSNFSLPRTGTPDQGAAYQIDRSLILHHNWGARHEVAEFEDAQRINEEVLRGSINRVRPDVVYFWNLFGLGWRLLQVLRDAGAAPSTFHFMDQSIFAYQSSLRTMVASLRGASSIWGDVRPFVTNAIFISNYIRDVLGVSVKGISKTIYPFLPAHGTPKKSDYALGSKVRGVFVGQIEEHKGIFFLCDTIKRYREDSGIDLHLDVYGLSRSGQESILITKYGDFVTVVANQNRSAILQRLASYDVGFFPSLWEEPFGIAQIEMMQAGLPVISSGRGGAGEVFDGNNLVLYRYDDQRELTEAINGLLTGYGSMAKRIGVAARDYVMSHHAVTAYLSEVESHLRSISEKHLSTGRTSNEWQAP